MAKAEGSCSPFPWSSTHSRVGSAPSPCSRVPRAGRIAGEAQYKVKTQGPSPEATQDLRKTQRSTRPGVGPSSGGSRDHAGCTPGSWPAAPQGGSSCPPCVFTGMTDPFRPPPATAGCTPSSPSAKQHAPTSSSRPLHGSRPLPLVRSRPSTPAAASHHGTGHSSSNTLQPSGTSVAPRKVTGRGPRAAHA